MTLADVLEQLLTELKTLAPAYIFFGQGKEKQPHFTLYPVSSTRLYGLCLTSILSTELIQLDVWVQNGNGALNKALELEAKAIDLLEPLGYALGLPTRTLNENDWTRRVMTVRRAI